MSMGFEPIFNYIVKKFTPNDDLDPKSFDEYFKYLPSNNQFGYEILAGLRAQNEHKQTLCLLLMAAKGMEGDMFFYQVKDLRRIIGSYLRLDFSKLTDDHYLQWSFDYYRFLESKQMEQNNSKKHVEKKKSSTTQTPNHSDTTSKTTNQESLKKSEIKKKEVEKKQFKIDTQYQEKQYSIFRLRPLVSPFNYQKEENLNQNEIKFQISKPSPHVILEKTKEEENQISPSQEETQIMTKLEESQQLVQDKILHKEKEQQLEQLNQLEEKVTIILENNQQEQQEKIPHDNKESDQILIKEIKSQDQLNQLEEKVTPIIENNQQNQQEKTLHDSRISDQFLIKRTDDKEKVTQQSNNQLNNQRKKNQSIMGRNICQQMINQLFKEDINQIYQKNKLVKQNFNQDECIIQIFQQKNYQNQITQEQSLIQIQPNQYYQYLFKDELNPFKKKFFLSKFMGLPILNFHTYKILLSHKNKVQNDNSNQLLFEQLINLELNRKRNQLPNPDVNNLPSSNQRNLSLSLMFPVMLLKQINRRNQAIHEYPLILSAFKKKIRPTQLFINVETHQIKVRKTIIIQENYWTHKIKKKNSTQENYGITNLGRRLIHRIKSCCCSPILKQ